ncbi:hypothetical protein [Bradyrhizobium retamae]|uniref:Uncharacterized protein n=1 Tax=Bradyrhizobium retamae TaxID=1300035 RepID=A0A0R3N0A4_9BRAD|nr:hypothetical protein [Bradyrhizobium retamae]KRR23597.1 hypothetical protein CQ13_06095 [Bradyrhizobium retamae]
MQMSKLNKFTMKLPDGMPSRLVDTDWGKRLLSFRDGKDHLFIAVRDNYLSVYINGRALFKKIEEKNGKLVATFDQRYLLGKDQPSGDLHFDGEKVYRKSGELVEKDCSPLNLSAWVNRVKSYGLVNLDDETVSDEAEDLSEKGLLASGALRPSVINLEMALPGFPSVSKRTGKEILIAPRIDMVHLEPTETGADLVFTEAKLFSNSGLRSASSKNPTVEQILKYQRYLDEHSAAICAAYVQACKHLVEIRRCQSVEIDPLLADVANDGSRLTLRTLPRLLIFKTEGDSRRSEIAWKEHERAIMESGISIEYA